MSAIKTLQNGAWQEIETMNVPVNGAYQEADHANALISGAWQEAWSCSKTMTYLDKTITGEAQGRMYNNGGTYSLFKYEDVELGDGSMSGSGTITFYLDGEWTNPTISLTAEGGVIRSNKDQTTWYRMAAGDVRIYAVTTADVVSSTTVVDDIGSAMTDSYGNIKNEIINYSGSLSGTFKRLGITMYVTGYSGSYYNCSLVLQVRDVLFNGKKILFPDYSFDT